EMRAQYQEIYGLQRSLSADDCLEHAEKLWVPLSRTKYHWLQAQLALEKATCANRILDFDMAAANVKVSRQIAQQFHFSELMLRVAGFDAGIQQWQENYYEGWKKAVRGLALYWQRGCSMPDDNAQSLQGTADVCPRSWERLYQFYSVMQQCARKLGLPHASEALLVRSMSILQDSAPDDIGLRAILHLRLANTLLRQSNPVLAEAEARKADSLLTQVPQHEGTAQIYIAATRIELSDFELKLGNAALALSEIDPLQALLTNQDDFIRLDFYTVKGEVLSQLKRFNDAVDAYLSGLRVAEGPLHGLQDDALRLNWALTTGRTYRGLTRSLVALGRSRDALSIWERFQSRSLNERTPGAEDRPEPSGNPGLYPTIPSASEPHLIYASFEDGLQIWVANGSQIRSQWVPVKQEDLRREIGEFAKQCANPSLSPDKSQALYSLILQPVVADLPPSGTIAIELDEALVGLTFEALRNDAGRYFADNHTVVYSPGLLAEETLRQPQRLTLQDPMLLVDASQSVEGAPLPGHSEEVTAVRRTFAHTRTLGPAEITSAEVRQALAQSSEFHFSGHGKPDGTGTALVIGSHLFLGANDLVPERLRHIQLAVLSACASGSGKKGTFDQSNLVRAFLSGGVPTVIASRWDVDSKSTAHFMQNFYGQLRSGSPPLQALEYAQAQMRAVQSHPYYWAAFNLTGRVN
ncbi:MAG TPA: CHAT domain-containing protein, partial [Candidatus Angelobacter sp.]